MITLLRIQWAFGGGFPVVGKAFTSREQDRVDLAFVRFLVESPTMLPLALGNNPLLQDLFDALSRREPGEIVPPKGYKTRSVIRRIATQFRDYVTAQLTEMHAFHHHLPFVKDVRFYRCHCCRC